MSALTDLVFDLRQTCFPRCSIDLGMPGMRVTALAAYGPVSWIEAERG